MVFLISLGFRCDEMCSEDVINSVEMRVLFREVSMDDVIHKDNVLVISERFF